MSNYELEALRNENERLEEQLKESQSRAYQAECNYDYLKDEFQKLRQERDSLRFELSLMIEHVKHLKRENDVLPPKETATNAHDVEKKQEIEELRDCIDEMREKEAVLELKAEEAIATKEKFVKEYRNLQSELNRTMFNARMMKAESVQRNEQLMKEAAEKDEMIARLKEAVTTLFWIIGDKDDV